MSVKRCLIIGGKGAIGKAVADEFSSAGYEVWTSGRQKDPSCELHLNITGKKELDDAIFGDLPRFDSVVWAQGTNLNDSISTFDSEEHREIMDANVSFIAQTLNGLLLSNCLEGGARLCVISSIWQEVIRPNKFSYAISKAAVGALVKSCAIDLSKEGYLINAVLPGVLDTPMTRAVLSSEEMRRVQEATGFGRLVTPEEIARTVLFLCSDSNTAITGQSLTVDLGFSNVRSV